MEKFISFFLKILFSLKCLWRSLSKQTYINFLFPPLSFYYSVPFINLLLYMYCQPSNILIDANFQAKLSDFGLSRVMDLGQSYVSSEVRGTFGYIDPEYRTNHQVKASGDVYSFGIVLLQLLSGQRVLNIDFQRPMSLGKMVRNYILRA